jgi:hypothetical protein
MCKKGDVGIGGDLEIIRIVAAAEGGRRRKKSSE